MSKINQEFARTTDRKKRPKCEAWLNQFLDKGVRVYYQIIKRDKTSTDAKYGIFVFPYDKGFSIARFSENKDGTVNWVPRTVPNARKGAKPLFVYDRLDVHGTIAEEVGKVLQELARGKDQPTKIERVAEIAEKIGGEGLKKKLGRIGGI